MTLRQTSRHWVWLKLTQHASLNRKLQKNPLITHNANSRVMLNEKLTDERANQTCQKRRVLGARVLRLYPLTEWVKQGNKVERNTHWMQADVTENLREHRAGLINDLLRAHVG
jgi:hypothetical protein